ncbi:thioredoxin-like protein [Thelonectria olida]|uniref:Thioredoxin-like protein n=1 Tax=Thelonectria olida TaxID=1576542 RepID=A0A9P8W986_9HYPO|nr:thioredoxin-like protein [Thelonectria olida]
MSSQAAADITLYTNHRCPWAHRAHIVLAELGIPFKEEIIDLDVPRSPEYLKVNPRGQVPTLVYNDEVIRESAIVAQFLADAYPSHLVPSTSDSNGPLIRARIAFFVDSWFTRVQSHYVKAVYSKSEQDTQDASKELVAAVEKEIEPLLAGAGPFFGGHEKITLAEVLTAPFVLRTLNFSKHGVIPASVNEQLEKVAPNFYSWAQEIVKHPAVLSIYNEETVVQVTKDRQAKLRA